MGACSLLAPSDRDLMGEPARATDGGVPADAPVSRPDVDALGPAVDAAAPDTTVPLSPACQACKKLSPACVAAGDCFCLLTSLCGKIAPDAAAGCTAIGADITMNCEDTSCTSSAGSVVCVKAGDSCPCN